MPLKLLLSEASQSDAFGCMQRLGKMVIKRVGKGRACEIPFGGHQVRRSLPSRDCLLRVMQSLRKHCAGEEVCVHHEFV